MTKKILIAAILFIIVVISVLFNNGDDRFSKLLLLAQQGNAKAQYHVGMMYNNGMETEKDYAKAFEWFQKAEKAGDPLAAYKMGCYYAGQTSGVVKKDEDLALKYKLVAAEAGYAFAQYDVAVAYYNMGNLNEATKWFKLSANQGYLEAARIIGALYFFGKEGQEGFPKDLALGYAYLVISKGKNPGAESQQELKELASKLSDEQRRYADDFISGWVPKPSQLTLRAMQGQQDADPLIND